MVYQNALNQLSQLLGQKALGPKDFLGVRSAWKNSDLQPLAHRLLLIYPCVTKEVVSRK